MNAAIICLLAVAASLSGYRLWHAGIHDSEYLANPTFWASAELPRIPAFHYGHGPYGTYVLAVSGDCSGCIGQLDFYKRVVAAARATAKGTKIVTVYPRNDRRVYDLLKQGSLDLMDTASADHVAQRQLCTSSMRAVRFEGCGVACC